MHFQYLKLKARMDLGTMNFVCFGKISLHQLTNNHLTPLILNLKNICFFSMGLNSALNLLSIFTFINFINAYFNITIYLGSQSSAKPPDKSTETIKLWRKRSWTVDELEGHEDRIMDCDVNIQHNIILTSSCDTTVKVPTFLFLLKIFNLIREKSSIN